MGAIFSDCGTHWYDKAFIHFTVQEWELQADPVLYIRDKFTVVGVTHPHVHGLAYVHISHFLKSSKEKDVYCEVRGNLQQGHDVFVLVC